MCNALLYSKRDLRRGVDAYTCSEYKLHGNCKHYLLDKRTVHTAIAAKLVESIEAVPERELRKRIQAAISKRQKRNRNTDALGKRLNQIDREIDGVLEMAFTASASIKAKITGKIKKLEAERQDVEQRLACVPDNANVTVDAVLDERARFLDMLQNIDEHRLQRKQVATMFQKHIDRIEVVVTHHDCQPAYRVNRLIVSTVANSATAVARRSCRRQS